MRSGNKEVITQCAFNIKLITLLDVISALLKNG